MENPPFVNEFPIQDGDFPLLCLFTGGYILSTRERVTISPWAQKGDEVAEFSGSRKFVHLKFSYEIFPTITEDYKAHTRWAPTSYKWSNTLFK